jgi:hypothetical protein
MDRSDLSANSVSMPAVAPFILMTWVPHLRVGFTGPRIIKLLQKQ